MINQVISIGHVNVDWDFAIRTYDAKILRAMDLNAFDRVILGILSISEETLDLQQLGRMMGFNVDDNPEQYKYRDNEECQILSQAVRNLEKYGLVVVSMGCVSLTEDGRKAFAEEKKHDSKNVSFDIYYDLTMKKDDVAKALFDTSSATEIEKDILIDSGREVEAIKNQQGCCLNLDDEQSLDDVVCVSQKIYRMSLTFDILYDFSNGTYGVSCMQSKTVEKYNEIVSENSDFQDAILEQFFSLLDESIIYKPDYQKKYEKQLANSQENTKEFNVASKSSFVHSMLCAENTLEPLMCFLLDSLSDYSVEELTAFAKKNISTMVCVEYVEGEDKYDGFSPTANVLFKKVSKLPCEAVCISTDGTYYKEEPFVFTFKDHEYQMPFVIKHEEKRYKTFMLAKTFAQEELKRMVKAFSPMIHTDKDFNRVKASSVRYKNIILLANSFSNMLHGLSINMDDLEGAWQWYLNRIMEYFETSLSHTNKTAGTDILSKLQTFKNICEQNAVELIPRIDKLQNQSHLSQESNRHAYLIDTNVFIDNPDCLNEYNRITDVVFIPMKIFEELDDKDHPNNKDHEQGRKAWQNIKRIIQDSPHFIQIPTITEAEMKSHLPNGYDNDKHDNHLLALALRLKKEGNFNQITLVTSDGKLRLKAMGLDIDVGDGK